MSARKRTEPMEFSAAQRGWLGLREDDAVRVLASKIGRAHV